jgi:hypothetical protein
MVKTKKLSSYRAREGMGGEEVQFLSGLKNYVILLGIKRSKCSTLLCNFKRLKDQNSTDLTYACPLFKTGYFALCSVNGDHMYWILTDNRKTKQKNYVNLYSCLLYSFLVLGLKRLY